MEGIETLSIKRTLHNVATQHNKLTTMVMTCFQEIEKLKKEIMNLKLNNSNTTTDSNNDNLKNSVPSNSKELENQANDILKQLNINN